MKSLDLDLEIKNIAITEPKLLKLSFLDICTANAKTSAALPDPSNTIHGVSFSRAFRVVSIVPGPPSTTTQTIGTLDPKTFFFLFQCG